MTAVAVLALALGIGANSAVFTFVNAVLCAAFLSPIPIMSSRWVRRTRAAGDSACRTSTSSTCGRRRRAFRNLTDGSAAVQRQRAGHIARTLQRRLRLGEYIPSDWGPSCPRPRIHSREDDLDGATPVVVLGFDIWQSRYAGDKGGVGENHQGQRSPATVVGVMPQGMQFPPNTDLWLPLGQATVNRGQSRQVRNYQVIARLADGVTIQQARSELTTIATRLARDYPTDQSRHRADDRHLQRARERAADQAGVLVADGSRRLCPADSLQQRGQPAAGALRRAREGGRCSTSRSERAVDASSGSCSSRA